MGKHWKYFFFLLWFSYLLVSGVLLFSKGFLLRRNALSQSSDSIYSPISFCRDPSLINTGVNKTTSVRYEKEPILCKQNKSWTVKGTSFKVILMVVDALKYEFACYNNSLLESQLLPYQNKLSVINEMLTRKPENSRLYKFIADPPTTTMQRLKGITTGSLPTFMDVGSNFATPEINEDNIIDQLRKHNKNIVFMGDDTWKGLYPKRFLREYAFPSFNVWDLDTVDSAIMTHLQPEILKNDWNLLIAHFLGVDHCGHRYGPYHSEMSRKLNEINTAIGDVIYSMDNQTLLFVIGDHGMTSTGDHGGDSDSEVTAAMFIYSPVKLISPQFVRSSNVVNQVDLVPTLSTILNIPIPFSNLGSVILDALPSVDSLENFDFVFHALWNNVEQATNYIKQYSKISKQLDSEKLRQLEDMYTSMQTLLYSVSDNGNISIILKDLKSYLSYLRQMCFDVWVEFDSESMSRGLLLVFLTLFFSYLIVDGLPGEEFSNILNSSFLIITYSGLLIIILANMIVYYLQIIHNVENSIYFSSGVFSMFMMCIIIIQNWGAISAYWFSNATDCLHYISRFTAALSFFAMFSNSYVVEEARLVSYFIITLIFVVVYCFKLVKQEVAMKSKSNDKQILWFKVEWSSLGIKLLCLSVLMVFLIRASQYYWRCREEQIDCQSYVSHKPHSSGSITDGKYRNVECLLTLVVLAVFVSAIRMWLRSCGNLVGFSPTIMLSRYSPAVIVVFTGGFWILHSLPKDLKQKFFLPWQLQFLPWIIYFLILTTLVTVFVQPLCLYSLPNNQHKVISLYGHENAIPFLFKKVKEMIFQENSVEEFPMVYGLATIYSAAFIIIGGFLCLLVVLLLGDVLAPSIVLMAATIVTFVTILSIIRTSKIAVSAQLFNVPWPSVICWGLLSVYYFYCTGHQPTFPNIHWDAAFVGTGGQFSNYLIPGLLIVINTFGSHLLHGILLPLVLIVPFTINSMFPKLLCAIPDLKDDDLRKGELVLYEKNGLMYRGLFLLSVRYCLFHGIRVFISMLAATVHCRHLMVWKVFAPKLIFEALSLFVTIPSILIAYLLMVRITVQIGNFLNNWKNR